MVVYSLCVEYAIDPTEEPKVLVKEAPSICPNIVFFRNCVGPPPVWLDITRRIARPPLLMQTDLTPLLHHLLMHLYIAW